MSPKEFIFKTCLFIILPGMLIYSCHRLNEEVAIDQAAHRACIESLRRPAVESITLIKWVSSPRQDGSGHFVRKCITDSVALYKLRVLAKGLRPVRVQPGVYRPSLRSYNLLVASGRDTCELEIHKMPLGKADLLEGAGDSAYEAPRVMPFLDSLFRSEALAQGRMPTKQGEGRSRN